MFPSFVFPSKLERRSEDCRCGKFDAFITFREGFAGGLEEFELGIVFRSLDKVNNPRQPALFYDCVVGLGASPLAWHSRVRCRLLHTLIYEDSHHLEDAIKMFRG